MPTVANPVNVSTLLAKGLIIANAAVLSAWPSAGVKQALTMRPALFSIKASFARFWPLRSTPGLRPGRPTQAPQQDCPW
jgi:hypothetical protein